MVSKPIIVIVYVVSIWVILMIEEDANINIFPNWRNLKPNSNGKPRDRGSYISNKIAFRIIQVDVFIRLSVLTTVL